MLRPRVVPVMTLDHTAMVKTERFSDPVYLGDPINALRVFNTKEVDEMVVLDITASDRGAGPDLEFVEHLASEVFMPLTFGGGVTSAEQAAALFEVGCEKVLVNTAFLDRPGLCDEMAGAFGSQSIVASVDVKRTWRGRYRVARTASGVQPTDRDPVEWARELASRGAGEIVVTSIDREGTAAGYDLALVRSVAGAVSVPVMALGGAADLNHLRAALDAGAAAAAAGRMFVTRGRHKASLVSYPSPEDVEALATIEAR